MQGSVSEGFRLSPQQKRLWLIQQGDHDPYRAICSIRIAGHLNRLALRAAVESIVAHHEIFRTTFQHLPGVRFPVQVIAEQGSVAWSEEDLTGVAADEQANRCAALWQAAESRRLDLENGPAFNAILISLAADDHRLLILLPAACADATTLELLAATLGDAYAAALARADYDPEIMQYADVAEWQNGLLESSETEEGRKFWRDYWQRHRLAGAYAATLPIEQPSGAVFTLQRLPIAIDHSLRQQLDTLARNRDVSTEIVLLVAWQSLLARLADYDNLAVAVAHDGRGFEELSEALGLFAKYLPVASVIDERSRFADLLAQTAAAFQEVQEWQEYFSWHEAELTSGKQGALPTLPFSFEYRRAAQPVVTGDVRLTIERLSAQIDRSKLCLRCSEHDGELAAALDYDAAFFTPDAAGCLAEQFHSLLASVVAEPEQAVGQLALLGPNQRQRVIVDFSRTALAVVAGSSFQQLFAEQAARTPEAVALVLDGRHLSYAELNSRANQLARVLRLRGVRGNALVGIYMRPSLEMIVALLGTLKAGGAYVPLDPGYPAERIQFMLADTRVALVLTQPSLLDALPPAATLVLDESWSALVEQSGADLPHQDDPAALAYVIYTSGSTGQPKGVAIEQRAVLNFKAAMDAAVYGRYSDTPLRVVLNAPISFDASVQQLIALLSGHTLHLLPDELRRDTPALIDYFRREHIDLFNCTPTQMQALLDAGLLDTSGHVPAVGLVAGEAISPPLWQALARAERTIFYNHYGPTEATVNATVCRIQPQQPRPSIGHPLGNYQAYLLDSQLEPVAIGVVGDLYLGGASLARGYLNRPDLTGERFIPHPWAEHPGERLYKTGDLARFQPDGTIEFIGRADTQVKLRGFRIELGEIEAVLRQHPAVREAVAIVREDMLDYRRLVAYVVEEPRTKNLEPRENHAESGSGFSVLGSPQELRAFLQDRLPEYMIPAAFVFLQALPLTPSGKLDRKALPAPDSDRPALSAAYVAPRTPLEATLAQIWSQALGVDQVGIDDSYIALGGDSIRSIQMQTLAREHQLQFSLQQLFQHRTIRHLAEAIASQQQEVEQRGSQPFSLISTADRERLPADAEDAYPLSMLQEGVVFHSEYSPDASLYQNLFSFHIGVAFKAELMQRAVQQLAARHAIMRTSVHLSGYSQPLQIVHRAAEVPLQIVDLRPYPPTEQESLLEQLYTAERRRPIDWEHPSLMRFFVHRRSDDSFQLSLIIHVALVDGWSVATLLTELFHIYLELLGVEIAPLAPPSSVAFREMIAVERESLASEASSRYWQTALAGSSFTMLPRWPSSRHLADPLYHKMLDVPISDELGRSLWALAQSAGVQIKTVLLAAHLRVMSVLSGQDDVVIGMISNGRPEVVDGDRVTGQFLNTVPLRSQQQGGSWLDLVRATFAAELDLLPHRRYPMAQIQQQQGGQPLFETIFNFTHFHVYDSLQSLPGITVMDRRFIEQTNLTLLADFGISSLTSEIRLVLNSTGLSDEQVEAMAHYYRSALVALVRDPQARYDRQSLLPIHEREQLLQHWSASLHNEQLEQRVHQLFEAQAARQPDALALTIDDRRVTYGELNARANQWARLLVEQGVGRESLVAMLLERGVEFVTAILAIYKAGGAFVPLDPGHPAQRHAELLRQCQSPVVLTSSQFLPELEAASVELPDTQRPLIVNVEELPAPTTDPGNLPLRCDAENLAYVMFTSGSTGQPKGAMLEQRGMRNHIYGKTLDLGLSGADVVAQNGPLSSNLIVWQCLAALLLGGRVHICDQSIAQDPRRLLAEVERGGITVLELVPSMLWALVYELESLGADRPALSSLRWVVPTADALPPDLCRRWLALYPQVPLLNTYGSTEVSDDACHYPIHDAPTLENQLPIMPAGKPIVNMRAYVLDRQLDPAPVGVAGELHIGGVGVGRGYLNDPQRTARVFVPDLYSATPGARLYKTGDLARYLPDGRLELLGRNDHQVKIRGFRVELGEIEAVLAQHPGIRQKVVVARPDASGNQSLVAYIVPSSKQSSDGAGAQSLDQADSPLLSASQLRLFVAERLPDHMVPSTFVLLDALPINQNGKIDRKALPMPDALRPQLDVIYVAPRTPSEETLVAIWMDLLHVDRIGVHDNFFDVGGHSLLATQLISRVRASFGITLTVRDLLLAPTVADQAAMLEAGLLELADEDLLDDLLDELDEDELLDELDEDAAERPIS